MAKTLMIIIIFTACQISYSQVGDSLNNTKNYFISKKVNDSLFIVKANDKYGLIDGNNLGVLPIKYIRIFKPKNSNYLIVKDNLSGCLLFKKGQNILFTHRMTDWLSSLMNHRNSLIKVFKIIPDIGLRYGYIDSNDSLKIDYIFENAFSFNKNRAIVKKNGLAGIIDEEGNFVVPLKYLSIMEYSNDLAVVKNTDSKYGYIDYHGATTIPFEYDYASDFHQNLAIISKGGKKGVIDKNNNLVIDTTYSNIYEHDIHSSSSLLLVEQNEIYGICNRKGNIIVPLEFEEDMGIFLGLIRVRKNKKEGIYDRSGKIIIPIEYDKVRIYPIRFIAVWNNGKVGVFDNDGRIVIPIEFDELSRISLRTFKVKKESEWKIYNLE